MSLSKAVAEFFLFGLFLFGANLMADVEVGGICYDPEKFYNHVTDVNKAPWEVHELYAVPVGTLSPDSWEYSAAFEQHLFSVLGTDRTPQAFAEACAEVWHDYFPIEAEVIVSFVRTITTTNNVLKCVSGNWVLFSVEPSESEDISDWLSVGTAPFRVADENSASVLRQELEGKWTDLNEQPGAAADQSSAE